MNLMADLIAQGIDAQIRYHPDGNGSTTNEYAVYVSDDDYANSPRFQGLHSTDENNIDEECDDTDPYADEESIFSCPRCEGRKVSYPEDQLVWLVFVLSLPLLCIPAIIYKIYISRKGTQKKCDSCRHTWRCIP